MLRRALESLLAQGERRWSATVLDDSPDAEGFDVVAILGDRRIKYQKNVTRLGAALNIDQGFGDFHPADAEYSFVLEDDNFALPGFLEHAESVMAATGARLALFNQLVAHGIDGARTLSDSTRGSWFPEGWVAPEDLHSSLLLMEGLSNGGIVWRPDSQLRLQVGGRVRFTALHEACRSLLVNEPFWFSSDTLLVWTELPIDRTARIDESARRLGRGYQSIIRFVLHNYGEQALTRAYRFASDGLRRASLTRRLLHAGAIREAFATDAVSASRQILTYGKGCVSRWIVPDPCAAFLAELQRSFESRAI